MSTKFKLAMAALLLGIGITCAWLWAPRGPLTRWQMEETFYLEPIGGVPAGMVWEHTFGHDFHTYYAGQEGGVQYGIYLGNHPSFVGDGDGEVVTMRLEQGPVRWLVARKDGHAGAQALVDLGGGEAFAHLFVTAPRGTSLEAALDGLASLRLEPVDREKFFLDWEAGRAAGAPIE